MPPDCVVIVVMCCYSHHRLWKWWGKSRVFHRWFSTHLCPLSWNLLSSSICSSSFSSPVRRSFISNVYSPVLHLTPFVIYSPPLSIHLHPIFIHLCPLSIHLLLMFSHLHSVSIHLHMMFIHLYLMFIHLYLMFIHLHSMFICFHSMFIHLHSMFIHFHSMFTSIRYSFTSCQFTSIDWRVMVCGWLPSAISPSSSGPGTLAVRLLVDAMVVHCWWCDGGAMSI